MAQSTARKVIKSTLSVLSVGGVGLIFSLENTRKSFGLFPTVTCELDVHSPKFPWSHDGVGKAFDSASIRRGYQVYKQVCAACHSNEYFFFRQLIGVSHTEQQAKAEAESFMIQDGPDSKGEMFMRKGKLFDQFPSPYPNEEAAKYANNGAAPPDLSLITISRHGIESYVFSLLSFGYCDPPAGIHLEEGLSYNVLFPGKQIAMPPPLYNGAVEYKDGTPATKSQLAKDVTTFLTFCAEKKHDERKKMGIKFLVVVFLIGIPIIYKTNHVNSYYKSQQYIYSTLGKKHWGRFSKK